MDISEYENEGIILYGEFADIVAHILDAAIRREGTKFRYQHIQRRSKGAKSLRDKLFERGKLDINTIEDEIKDLAGCRVIFYSNADVSQFLGSTIIRDNFKIDPRRTKAHHPVPGVTLPGNQFKSVNIVVRLKDDRASLPEYARYSGLLCEIQVQTILNHAWSETSHDMIYKRPRLSGVGKALLQSIDSRLERIMKKYLEPAGYQFQKALNDFDQLLKAKELSEGNALGHLISTDNNNVRYELLESVRDVLIPNIDDLRATYPAICQTLVDSVDIARATAMTPNDVEGMTFPGVEFQQYFEKLAATIEAFIYADIEKNFDAILLLFQRAQTDWERNRIVKIMETLARHDLDAWKQVGGSIQRWLVDRLSAIPEAEIKTILPIVASALEKTLAADVSGTSASYESMTWSFGAVVPGDFLTKLRQDAIVLVKSVYKLADSRLEKLLLIQALSAATRTPRTSKYSDDLLLEILKSCEDIVRFYADNAEREDFDVLRKIENDVLWLHRWHGPIETEPRFSTAAKDAAGHLREAIVAFREIVDRSREFTVFKTIVGYDSVFPPSWDSDEFDVTGVTPFREKAIDEFIQSMTRENRDYWHTTIYHCAQSVIADPTIGGLFYHFLRRLGEEAPLEALTYLDDDTSNVARFFAEIMMGMEATAHRNAAHEKAETWTEAGIHLVAIAKWLQQLPNLNLALLEKLLKRAIEKEDDELALNCFYAVIRRRRESIPGLEKAIVGPAIHYFSRRQRVDWTREAWYPKRDENIFCGLSGEAIDLVLDNLVYARSIDHYLEDILAFYADDYPEKILTLFEKRLNHRTDRTPFGSKYDAIPYEFHRLKKLLAKSDILVFDTARRLALSDDYMTRYGGIRILKSLFPDLSEALKVRLITLARSSERTDLIFVMQILREFENAEFLYCVCKELVETLPSDDELLGEVRVILAAEGVTAGQFGRVEAIKRKSDEMQAWLEDPREKVREFAEDVIRRNSNELAMEQKYAEEEGEMRKLRWESDDDPPTGSDKSGEPGNE